ncbi:photosystem II S4 domain protein [Synechococcus sp. UW179A]|uniref:photosystem II S4 domain protein n=1 Tax=Synechococcus sp. UW179A TaxID=2575510 RepID=UPI000E0EF4F8|nr:photosystem II S4 domain protein [Synechococcus sp. UW179A]
MSLPRGSLIEGLAEPEAMHRLIEQAEEVLRTWQPSWSSFLSGPELEDSRRLEALTELRVVRDGGRPDTERCRLQLSRSDQEPQPEPAPISGLRLEGNFLFDRAEPQDMRQALIDLGVNPDGLGDLWLRGDRGAQAVCTPEAANHLNGLTGQVRDVTLSVEAVSIDCLQWPAQRLPKRFTSVEASCRLDAIASAGFGLSRSKVIRQIRDGRLRLNWHPVRQASRELKIGDRLQLQDRGSVEVLNLEITKRNRWRVEMLRR